MIGLALPVAVVVLPNLLLLLPVAAAVVAEPALPSLPRLRVPLPLPRLRVQLPLLSLLAINPLIMPRLLETRRSRICAIRQERSSLPQRKRPSSLVVTLVALRK